MYAWLATDNSIHQGQLLKHDLDVMDMAENALKEDSRRIWTRAYLSLASLYWIRSVGGWMIIRGIDIYDAQRSILEKLRTSLTRAAEMQTASDQLKFRNARLLALFVGAQAEQSWRCPGWINDNLRRLVKDLNLFSWTAFRTILEGFLYTDMLPPHGSTWYEQSINANLDARKDK